VLRCVRFKVVASPEAVARGAGIDEADAATALDELGAAGFAVQTPRGWRLTPDGQAILLGLLERERAAVDTVAARRTHECFTPLDAELKRLITDYQLSGEPAMAAPDVQRLADVNHAAREVVEAAVAMTPRLAAYGYRLERAMAEIAAGDVRFLAHPLVDSYHTVWFELHEELLHLAGLKRGELEETGPNP
jgi:pyruvate,orthophosphate dikinase